MRDLNQSIITKSHRFSTSTLTLIARRFKDMRYNLKNWL